MDDEVTVYIPVDATDEYIESKIKEIEKLYNKEAIHSYTVRYCSDDYFELDENDRKSCEESIEAILSGKVEEKSILITDGEFCQKGANLNNPYLAETVEDNANIIYEPPF